MSDLMMKTIVATGSSGFIGKNISKFYKKNGYNVIEVDIFPFNKKGNKYNYLYFLNNIDKIQFDAIIHNGACSDTTEKNYIKLYNLNINYTIRLINHCYLNNKKLIYASSASVYGDGPFSEKFIGSPKNLYAKSKYIVDEYFKTIPVKKNIVGLRYFNVYGPEEFKKGDMSSVMLKFYKQIVCSNSIKIFENSENFIRDFIYIDDIVCITDKFLKEKDVSGIYNLGTGTPRSFYDIAKIYKDIFDCKIEYIPMPDKLSGKYQKYTRSDNSKIEKIFKYKYFDLESGILKYLKFLKSRGL